MLGFLNSGSVRAGVGHGDIWRDTLESSLMWWANLPLPLCLDKI